jgi:hypothetical protein
MTTMKKVILASVVALMGVGVLSVSSEAKADECERPAVVQPVAYGYGRGEVARPGYREGWRRGAFDGYRRERFERGRRFDRFERGNGRYGRR